MQVPMSGNGNTDAHGWAVALGKDLVESESRHEDEVPDLNLYRTIFTALDHPIDPPCHDDPPLVVGMAVSVVLLAGILRDDDGLRLSVTPRNEPTEKDPSPPLFLRD